MSCVIDPGAARARDLAGSFWTACREYGERLHLVGLRGPCLTRTDDGDRVLVDLAACMTVAHSLVRLDVASCAVRGLKASDRAAHRLLARATTAHFSSRELRDELGRVAGRSFERLRTGLHGAA